MKKIIIAGLCLCVTMLLDTGPVMAQTDLDKYKQQQQKSLSDFKQQKQDEFKRYRDSLNRQYADFLEKGWKQFTLQQPEPYIKTPIDVPPIFDENKHMPKPDEIPVVKPPVDPTPTPIIPQPQPEPIPVPPITLSTVFFGTNIHLKKLSFLTPQLQNTSEKEVAKYWRSLTYIPYMDVINDVIRIKTELSLNDWGVYKLLDDIFDAYIPNRNKNEQVIFNVFMLNQMGFRAKVGRSGSKLIPLISFTNEVTNCTYFRYGGNSVIKYYAVNSMRQNITTIETCPMDYTDAINDMNLQLSMLPNFSLTPITKTLSFGKSYHSLTYNKNLIDFYDSYPCVEFSLYVETPLDEITLKSIETEIIPHLVNKSQEDAVNWLLHFVQNTFEYKTDDDQFGYEKFFFAEETIAALYSDCEDRSILFAQLVRQLLKMPVVLIYYPGVHLATAVKFSDPNIVGDYVIVNGEKYLICDPTYINANLGMSMPQLRNIPIQIYK